MRAEVEVDQLGPESWGQPRELDSWRAEGANAVAH